VREEYCWLVVGGWFVVREKYCWLVADKPSEQGLQISCALLCHKTTLSKKIDWPKHCYVQWFVIGACLDVCVRFIDTKAGGVGVQCYQGSMSFVISVKELPYLEISVSVCLTQQDSR
jgi:hypothetical protein